LNNVEKGDYGERLAAEFLKGLGYELREANYSLKFGEIDIIATTDNCLVFVEVKLRTSVMFGRPCEAVGYKKQQKIKRCAAVYIANNKLNNMDCRFDVIEILNNNKAEITHIINAF